MKKYLFLLFFVLVFFILNLYFLFSIPAIWPDEAVYADIAMNFINGKGLAASVWEFFPSFNHYTFYYPPLYFLFLAILFKFIGLSIFGIRLLSLVSASLLLIIFYKICLVFFGQNKIKLAFLSTFFLAIDFLFIRAAHLGRMEIFILLFGFYAIYFLIKIISPKNLIKSNQHFLIAGLLFAPAFLSHYIGIVFSGFGLIYLLLTKIKNKFKKLLLFGCGFILGNIPWIIYVFLNFSIFVEQMQNAIKVHHLNYNWGWIVLHVQTMDLKILTLFTIFLDLLILIFFFISKRKSAVILLVILSVMLYVSLFNSSIWYTVYVSPFIYLSIGYLFRFSSKIWLFRKILLVITLGIVFINLNISFQNLSLVIGENYSYDKFSDKILKEIPYDKSVFLSVIPDVYFPLKKRNPNQKIYEFPAIITAKENYLTALNSSDYIVYSGSYEYQLYKNLIEKYIVLNKHNIIQISEKNQYNAIIIQLKPKAERQTNFE